MAHRTQITLTDAQYERLRGEAATSGMSLAELVRRAVDQAYGVTARSAQERSRILHQTAGAWRDLDESTDEFMARVRPGWDTRRQTLDL